MICKHKYPFLLTCNITHGKELNNKRKIKKKKMLQIYMTLLFYSDAHELIVIIEEAPSVENPPVEERSFRVYPSPHPIHLSSKLITCPVTC